MISICFHYAKFEIYNIYITPITSKTIYAVYIERRGIEKDLVMLLVSFYTYFVVYTSVRRRTLLG